VPSFNKIAWKLWPLDRTKRQTCHERKNCLSRRIGDFARSVKNNTCFCSWLSSLCHTEKVNSTRSRSNLEQVLRYDLFQTSSLPAFAWSLHSGRPMLSNCFSKSANAPWTICAPLSRGVRGRYEKLSSITRQRTETAVWICWQYSLYWHYWCHLVSSL